MENQTYSITRSYSRTVQIKQFEPAQWFASRTYHWHDEQPTTEEVARKSQSLFEECFYEIDELVRLAKGQELKNNGVEDVHEKTIHDHDIDHI